MEGNNQDDKRIQTIFSQAERVVGGTISIHLLVAESSKKYKDPIQDVKKVGEDNQTIPCEIVVS